MIIVSFSVFFVAIIFSVIWSFTSSGMFPGFNFVGLAQPGAFVYLPRSNFGQCGNRTGCAA